MEALKTSLKKKMIRYSKSLIVPYNQKEYNAFDEKENNNNNINFLFNRDKDNSFKNLSEKDKKHLLIIQKININDKKNKFYKEGVNDIFNDEKLFFSDKYKNNKVVVGRNSTNKKSRNTKLFPNVFKKKTLGNFNKKRLYKAATIKNFNLGKFQKNELSNSLRKKNGFEKNYLNNNNNDYPPENINNYSISSLNSRFDHPRKSLNLYGKRGNIFVSNQNNITDGELNLIYKKFLDREQENKQKEIKLLKLNSKNKKDMKDNKIKEYQNKTLLKDIDNKVYKKLFKTTIDKEINSRLNLQKKILNKYQFINKQNQNLLKKILKKTTKDNNDILLMNQLDDYRIKMEKIDEEQRMKKDNNYNKTIYWLSSLRNYPNNNLNNLNNNENKINNINNNSFPTIYNKMRKCNLVNDDIFDNYINNIHYSFGSNSNLYCDIESNISPLYAFILSDSLKSNEKIRNTHIDDYYSINNKNCQNKNNFKQLKKNLSVPSLNNRIKLNDKNNIQDLKYLNVEGKRLIEQEMRISKQLEGKKKRLIKTTYNDDEIDNKILAKSYLLDFYHFPKAVKNALELHNPKNI